MKFTCDRCGKRFSSVDEPMPGRVYRIRCRCGNAIQISAPQLMPDAAPRRKGGMPLHDEGSLPAMPPLPSGPRSATPAGDAGAPVRHATTSTRIPAFPKQPAAAPFPRADAEHPQATPASVLMPGTPPPLAPEPSFARPGTSSRSIPLPPSSSPRLPAAPPRRVERAAPPPESAASSILEPIEFPDDPFAAAAAHAARLDARPEPGAPAPRAPRPAARAPSLGREPPADDLSAELLAPQEEAETSIDLSVSEQYALKAQKSAGRRKPLALAAAAVVLVAAGAAGAYVLTARGPGRISPPPAPQARVAVPVPPPPSLPPPEPKVAAPAPAPPAPEAPAAAAAAPPAAVPSPAPPVAMPPPVVATPTPAPPAPPASPRPSSSERREAARRAAADRKAEAARRAEERRAEAARKAEEKRAETARRAEADRVAKAERQADAERKAEAARKADAERKAEAARKAEADRVAAAERKAEADRNAEAERKARAERRTASASPVEQKPKAVDPAPAVAPRPQSLPEGLDPAEMQAVLRANRAALEGCVERALADPATAAYAGRKVSLIILVAPSGRAEAAVEEPDLDASAFGTCLRRAAAKMSFPAFRGDPVGAQIPLVMGRR